MTRRFRFGPFEFDATTGDLWFRDPRGRVGRGRLAPQPAQLLSMLLAREGGLARPASDRRACT